MFDKQDNSGVSPVIGVILMVAVTVALVALVTVTVFDLGGDVSESPDATVQLEEFTDGDGNPQVRATLLRNENVDELYLRQGGNSWDTDDTSAGYAEDSGMSDAGDVIETDNAGSNDASTGSPVNVIAVMPDGNEEVLTSTTIE